MSEDPINPIVRGISEASGLSFSTVWELLQSGWTYTQELGKPSRFEDPSARLTK